MLTQQMTGDPEAWTRAFHATNPVPALSLAVSDPDGVKWSTALGMSDIELGVAALPEHRFRIGSVSKVITTTAAARLASRGLVEFDVPISYWLPDLPPHHRATTLRQLFTHRGGVRHYLAKDVDAKQPGGSVLSRAAWTNAEILAAFIDDDLISLAGEQVSYSSWGYSLASLVMEAAAGQPFLEIIETQIACPFGLETLAADQPDRIVPGRVRGYASKEERRRLRAQFPESGFPDPIDDWANAAPINPAYCWAGAGLLMSMPDLARFGASLIEGPDSRITAEERELLFTPVTKETEHGPPLGLGWRVDTDERDRLRWHHAGATPGGRAVVVIYPEQGRSIALASNVMVMPCDVLEAAAALADIFT